MKSLIEMATRQDKPISEQERQALIAIRKEYYRRDITINYLIKDINLLEREKNNLEDENNQYIDIIVKQIEFNRTLNFMIEELKR